MAPIKVIGAGCGRTGTESLRYALNLLGYNCHHAHCFLEDPTLNPTEFTNAVKDRDKADWDKMYEKFDAAVDWPTVEFYKEVYRKYPDAKVILTIRSPESWYKSVKNTVHLASIKAKDVITPEHPMYAFGKMCEAVTFDGALADPVRFTDEEAIKKLFNDHNEEVKRVIPADKLYIMELGSGWEGLCKFLGKDIPDVPYPNGNSTVQFQEKISEIVTSSQKTDSSGETVSKVAAASN